MTQNRQLAEELIAEAQKRDNFRAGIADLNKVLDGPSYKAEAVGTWQTNHSKCHSMVAKRLLSSGAGHAPSRR